MSCPTGKRRYLTAADAAPYLRSLKFRSHPAHAAKLDVYGPCPQCGGWHIGHNYGPISTRTQRRGKHAKRKVHSADSR
jgi:hypothetical protein